jgi:FkbM family methyltransferase
MLARCQVRRGDLVTGGVLTQTLDVIAQEAGMSPGFINIDVEGMEYVVLLGGANTLAAHHPAFPLEVKLELAKANG